MVEAREGMEDFCQDIESYFNKSDNIISSGRNIIKIVEYNGKRYSVKSFKIPHLLNRFAYRFLRDSKAKRSYQNANKLLELDIFTPLPIGYKEEFTPLLKKSYYICEYFDFDFEIRDVLKDKEFIKREEILKEFVSYSYGLHQKGVYHIDYSPGNVLIKKSADGYRFGLVDLNRMKFIKFNNELRFKNLSRFSADEEDTIFIAKEYAKISNINEDLAFELLKKYHDKHQLYLQRKRDLKRIKR